MRVSSSSKSANNKYFWTGIILSPVVLGFIWFLQNQSPMENTEAVDRTPVATFDFLPTTPHKSVSDKAFTKISMSDKSQTSITLADFAGKPTIIHFWGTWCGACLEEIPELDQFAQTYGDNVNVVIVAFDREGQQSAAEFYESKGLKASHVYVDSDGDFIRDMRVKGFPSTIFVSPKGEEIGRVLGPIEWLGDSGKLIRTSIIG